MIWAILSICIIKSNQYGSSTGSSIILINFFPQLQLFWMQVWERLKTDGHPEKDLLPMNLLPMRSNGWFEHCFKILIGGQLCYQEFDEIFLSTNNPNIIFYILYLKKNKELVLHKVWGWFEIENWAINNLLKCKRRQFWNHRLFIICGRNLY